MDTPATICSTSTREYSNGLSPRCRLTQIVAANSTLMVVIKCEAKSCLMVNPHLSGAADANTVYGSNSVMEMVVPGDEMSFFSWLTEDFETARIGTESLTVTSSERVTDASVLAEANTLPPEIGQHGAKALNPVSLKNTTVNWEAWDVWRVEFAAPVPAGVVRKSMVQIDTISNAGTVLRNNTCEDAASSRSRPTICLDPRCCCRQSPTPTATSGATSPRTPSSRATPSATRRSPRSSSRGCRSSSRAR